MDKFALKYKKRIPTAYISHLKNALIRENAVTFFNMTFCL